MLQGTQTDFKNELLFTTFGINYSTLPERFRKVRGVQRQLALHCRGGGLNICLALHLLQGSVVVRSKIVERRQRADGSIKEKEVVQPTVLHVDLIRDAFWLERPELLR